MQKLFTAICDAAATPTFLVDDAAVILHANRAAAALAGVPADEMRGLSLEELAPAADPGLGRSLAGRLERAREGAFAHGGGTRVISQLRILRSVAPNRHLVLLGDDPGALDHLAEAEAAAAELLRSWERELAARRRAEIEVAESRRIFERIAEVIPDMIYLFDSEQREVVYMNRSLERALGLSCAEVAERHRRFVAERVHPDDAAALVGLGARFEALEDGALIEREFRMRFASGEYRWVATRMLAMSRAASGVPKMILGLAHDVTDRKLAEQERDHLLEREQIARMDAENANRAKDEFLAMLGHELRNPLSPIVTALQLMKLRGGDALARERTIIERQVRQMVQLVDDLLDVSRITRGKILLKRELIEVADAVAQAVEMTSPLLEERGHHLTVEATRPLQVNADPRRLAQIFSNLLSNAAKYTDPGGRIEVGAVAEGDAAVIRIRDSGVGIPREIADRLFDRFVQATRPLDRAQGGLGLGLSIVKSLVEIHGGTVSAESGGPGRGSLFRVTIPRASERPAERARATLAPGPPDPAGGAIRVLIVDDNRDAADSLTDVLRCSGFDARAAYDGPSALELAHAFPPKLALLDIGLPVMDGYELAARLRELDGDERPRLVALTGYGQESDRNRSRDAGFEQHLVKPIDLERVLAMVRALASEAPAPRATRLGASDS